MGSLYEVYRDRIFKDGEPFTVPSSAFPWGGTSGYSSRSGKDLTGVTQIAVDGDEIHIKESGRYFVPVVYHADFTLNTWESYMMASDNWTYEPPPTPVPDKKKGLHTGRKDVDLIADVPGVEIEMSAPTDKSYSKGFYPYSFDIGRSEFPFWGTIKDIAEIRKRHNLDYDELARGLIFTTRFGVRMPFAKVKNVKFVKYSGKGMPFQSYSSGGMTVRGWWCLFNGVYNGFEETALVYEDCVFEDVNVDLWRTSQLLNCRFIGTQGVILSNIVGDYSRVSGCVFDGCTASGPLVETPVVVNSVFKNNVVREFVVHHGLVLNCSFIDNKGSEASGIGHSSYGCFILNSYFGGNSFSMKYGYIFYNCVADSEDVTGCDRKYRCVSVDSLSKAIRTSEDAVSPVVDLEHLCGTGLHIEDAIENYLSKDAASYGSLYEKYKNAGIDLHATDIFGNERDPSCLCIGPVDDRLAGMSIVKSVVKSGKGIITPAVSVVRTGSTVELSIQGDIDRLYIDGEEQANISNKIRLVTTKRRHTVEAYTGYTVYASGSVGDDLNNNGCENSPYRSACFSIATALFDGFGFERNDSFNSAQSSRSERTRIKQPKIVVLDGTFDNGNENDVYRLLSPEEQIRRRGQRSQSYDDVRSSWTLCENGYAKKLTIFFKHGSGMVDPTFSTGLDVLLMGEDLSCTIQGTVRWYDGAYPPHKEIERGSSGSAWAVTKFTLGPNPGYNHNIFINNMYLDGVNVENHPNTRAKVTACSGSWKDVRFGTFDSIYGSVAVGCDMSPLTEKMSGMLNGRYIACNLENQEINEWESVKPSEAGRFDWCRIVDCPRVAGVKYNCYVRGIYDRNIVSGTVDEKGIKGKGSAEYDPYTRTAAPTTHLGMHWASNSLVNGDSEKLRPEHTRYVVIPNLTYNDAQRTPVKELKPISYFPTYPQRFLYAKGKVEGTGTVYYDPDKFVLEGGKYTPTRENAAGTFSYNIPAPVRNYLRASDGGRLVLDLYDYLYNVAAVFRWFERFGTVVRPHAPILPRMYACMTRAGLRATSFLTKDGSCFSTGGYLGNSTAELGAKYGFELDVSGLGIGGYKVTEYDLSSGYYLVQRAFHVESNFLYDDNGLMYHVFKSAGILKTGMWLLDFVSNDTVLDMTKLEYAFALADGAYLHHLVDDELVETTRKVDLAIDSGTIASCLYVSEDGSYIFGGNKFGIFWDPNLTRTENGVVYKPESYIKEDERSHYLGYFKDIDNCTLKKIMYLTLIDAGYDVVYSDYYIPSLGKKITGFKLPKRLDI